MKRTMKYITYVQAALLAIALYSCSDEVVNHPEPAAEGTLLNLYIGSVTQPTTRLAELGNSGNISNGQSPTQGDNKKNIGLYIYYQDDYDKNDLSRPYVRNLECKVEGRKIVPVDGSDIYIYDRMTIVAFYPYNGEAGDYTFKKRSDEKKYSITEGDYSYQYYIPYRARTDVNPTTAYYVGLNLIPQQTVKIQVVLVASDPGHFPGTTTKTNGAVKLVPDIDPVDAGSGDKRENWVDIVEQSFAEPDPVNSGQYVQRFTSYIWRNDGEHDPHHGDKPNHNDNTIKKGEILFKSDKLTLFFPQDVDIREGSIYRYGYNINTGELFIPTSDALIYDAKTLKNAGGGGYQVCDINLEGANWTPVNLTGTYDGGGHIVKNMQITQVPADKNIGLFGSLTGNSLIKNLHLESPVIDIDFSENEDTDVLKVGALVGQLNKALTEDEIAAIRESIRSSLNLPDGLPQSVIDALVADMMKDITGGTSSVQGCKVSNPEITVKGDNVIVGGFAGSVGGDDKYKGAIKDSYVSGGSVKVNEDAASGKLYENVEAGAFAGLFNSGSITNSYTTASAEAYVKEETGIPPVITSKEVAKGFANVATPTPDGTKVEGSFTADLKENVEDGVSEFNPAWPTWNTYGGNWPVTGSTLGNYWGDLGGSPSTYPSLVWETRLNVQK